MTQSSHTPLPSPKERRRLREAKSLSQADVATEVGVTVQTVRSWETGRTTPRGRKREAYAKLLASMAADAGAEAAPSPEPAAAPAGTTVPAKAAHTPADTPAEPPARTPEHTPARTSARPAAPAPKPPHPTPDPTSTTRAPALVGAARAAVAAPAATATFRPRPGTPADAFDALLARSAPALVRQTYLLTGRRALAQESVERAFQLAWQRWPEVARDRDPAGWVRAAAYEYAMSPWHRFRPANRHPDAPPADPADRPLFDVLLNLPPSYRRTLLLYDGVGLDLPETAAETEASTPAAAGRVLHARQAIAERLPELAAPEALHRRLGELARAEKLDTPTAERVRTGSESRARFWTRAAIAFTTLIIGATALTLTTAPTHYEPPQSPGAAITGVPPRMGPGPLSYEDRALKRKLREEPQNGPGRLVAESR